MRFAQAHWPIVLLLALTARGAARAEEAPRRYLYAVCPGIRDYICVNGLLGFEIGDLASGEKLHRIQVAGFSTGPVNMNNCSQLLEQH